MSTKTTTRIAHRPLTVGMVFEGVGTILSREANDKWGARMVKFRCAVCGGVSNPARFNQMCSGVVKSCGCLEKKADREFQGRLITWVDHLQTRERKSIFTSITLFGTAGAMKRHELSKRRCDTLWRLERDRLAQKLTPERRKAIHAMAQDTDITNVASKYRVTVAEALHITRAEDKKHQEPRAALKAKIADLRSKGVNIVTPTRAQRRSCERFNIFARIYSGVRADGMIPDTEAISKAVKVIERKAA